MAATATAAALTEAQRQEQLAVRNGAVAEFIAQVWPLLDPRSIDNTSAAWVALVLDLINRWRGRSGQSAANYYLAARKAETGQLVAPDIVLPGADPRAVLTSLMVTGPIGIKQRLAKGVEPDKAAKLALVESSGAVARHVLDGGRDTLVQAVESDELAVGFARVTGPHPCAFCAMLASRGYAYKSRESALLTSRKSKLGADQRYHDHCACGIEVAFQHGSPLPPNTARWERLWADSTRGKSGKDALTAFRDAHAQLLDGSDAGPESA